jgi:hypothetical protein
MLKQFTLTLVLTLASAVPSFAQAQNQFSSTANAGQSGNTSNQTGTGPSGMGGLSSWATGPQSSVWNKTGFGQLAGTPMPTVLDSFVKDSGYNDMIYGDEGVEGPPPHDDFLPIGAGMSGMPYLTTGNQYTGQTVDGITIGEVGTDMPTGDLVIGALTAAQLDAATAAAAQQAAIDANMGVIPGGGAGF